MLEEFRRRKKLKDYFGLMKQRALDKHGHDGTTPEMIQDMDDESL